MESPNGAHLCDVSAGVDETVSSLFNKIKQQPGCANSGGLQLKVPGKSLEDIKLTRGSEGKYKTIKELDLKKGSAIILLPSSSGGKVEEEGEMRAQVH